MIFKYLWRQMMKYPQGSAGSLRFSKMIAFHLTPMEFRPSFLVRQCK